MERIVVIRQLKCVRRCAETDKLRTSYGRKTHRTVLVSVVKDRYSQTR